MTVRRKKYLHVFIDRHGKERRYFRRPGYPQIALPADKPVDSDEFTELYKACWDGTKPTAIGAARTKSRSMNALIVEYYKSADFTGLSTATQQTYRRVLERIREKFGDLPVAKLERKNIVAIRNTMADRPTSANFMMRMFHTLMQTAIDLEWRDDDPTLNVKKVKVSSDGYHTWTEEEIAQFEGYWAVGTRERLAFDLLLYTAQRSRDVRVMGRQHVSRGQIALKREGVAQHDTVNVKQSKTHAVVDVPIHPQLQVSLATVPPDQMLFLVTPRGKPFTPAGFGNFIRDAIRKAGLSVGIPAHGLRKAAARRLAEAGCTAHQIMAVTGHKTLREVQRYCDAAERKRLAQQAMDTQIANSAEHLGNDTSKPG